jgi:hypothetical protein
VLMENLWVGVAKIFGFHRPTNHKCSRRCTIVCFEVSFLVGDDLLFMFTDDIPYHWDILQSNGSCNHCRNELRAACRKPPLWSAQSLSSLFRYSYTTKFEIFAKFWFIIHDCIMNKDLSRGLVRTYCLFGAQTWSRTCVCIAMIASLLKLLRTICTESSSV